MQHRRLEHGYRVCPTFSSAFWSLFEWHNESINIWSHYALWILLFWYAYAVWEPHIYVQKILAAEPASLVLAVATLNDPSVFAEHTDVHSAAATTSEELQDALYHVYLFTLLILGSSMPAFLSAFCHQFYCVSKAWHKFCWFADFMGIMLGMFFTGVSFISMAFRCNFMIWSTLLFVLTVMGVAAVLRCWRMLTDRVSKSALVPVDRFPEFSANLSMYAWFATMLPVVLACCLKREYLADPNMRSIIMHSLIGPALMGMGVVVFAQGGFPECFAAAWGLPSNFFDYLGHSHQFWHIEVALLQFYWVHVIHEHYRARVHYGC